MAVFTQITTKASGKSVLIIAKSSAQLAIQVAIAQADNVPTALNINSTADANKFGTRYANNPSQAK